MESRWKRDQEQEPLTGADDREHADPMVPEPGEAEFGGGEEELCFQDRPEADGSVEISALEEEKKMLIDRLSRLQADFDNYRKRVEKERAELIDYACAQAFTDFLPILDNFERALGAGQTEGENFVKGVELIYRQFLTFLEKQGVAVIEAEGALLDPHLHHAVLKEPGPAGVAEDTVIGVLQKGYLLKDRVLRPAMVKVAE